MNICIKNKTKISRKFKIEMKYCIISFNTYSASHDYMHQLNIVYEKNIQLDYKILECYNYKLYEKS